MAEVLEAAGEQPEIGRGASVAARDQERVPRVATWAKGRNWAGIVGG